MYNYEPFQWKAVTHEGEEIFEINEDNSRNSIKEDVNINNIDKFGICEVDGTYLYFDIDKGVFNILGNRIELKFFNDDEQIDFMSNNINHSDVIIYRQIEEIPGINYKNILSYNFGYKSKIRENFFIKFITHLQNDGMINISFKLVFDKEVNGNLKLYVNGEENVSYIIDNESVINMNINLQ